ncbi:prickle-like protein 4 [Ursus maritimus]|uniref:Prickle-like protein 4 n=1 Tax=Ursus maritimus TaxID=29073 RepID=A0A8M1GUG6_URSMA|nr:prickle-like protein 4 [Ursus maritimus]
MSVLNSDGPPQGESLSPHEPGPPASSDSDPGHLPEGLPEETSQVVEALPFPLRPDMPSILQTSSHFHHLEGSPRLSGGLFLQERYCLALGDDELAELRLFCAQRRREALGQGVARLVPPKLAEHTCEKCRERLRPGEYRVFAARAGERRRWHPACFACQACGQALMNLIYFYHDGLLYCGRHHAELLRPRCPACDQLIFSRRCTEAEGRRWHENHFCCQDCAGPLGGGRYALPGGSPCCPSCFESRYSDAGSSQAPTLEGRASLGEARLDRVEGDCALLDPATTSRAALLASASLSSPETQRGLLRSSPEQEGRAGDEAEAPKGRERGRLETPLGAKEDGPCPTCSSSDSEPEGFFLGQRLPGPWKTPGSLQAGDSDTSRKHCTIC